MTAAELIELLKTIPPETRVMVSGYEGGYCDASDDMTVAPMCLDVHSEWYYGPHDRADSYANDASKTYITVPTVVI